MKFRLTYEGVLPAASQRNNRSAAKHRIREALHPQLCRLWNTHLALKDLKLNEKRPDGGLAESRPAVEVLATNFETCGYNFVPLINEHFGLACKLNILFLRPEQPGNQLIKSGDIDNRLKTLFDALRIPRNRSEIGSQKPKKDQRPFFCLLEDDSLINHIEVETDLMLQEVDGRYDDNHVRLVISIETIRVGYSFLSMHF